jgi:Fe-S-cluster-containing dehydrogenase component
MYSDVLKGVVRMSFKNILGDWSRYRRGREEGGFHNYEHKWGMAIDLNKCIGCNACSVACYAENNLAVVGPDRYAKHQAMNWMRIERYWDEPDIGSDLPASDYAEKGASFLPMNCQQCMSATCEPVCPVAAT